MAGNRPTAAQAASLEGCALDIFGGAHTHIKNLWEDPNNLVRIPSAR